MWPSYTRSTQVECVEPLVAGIEQLGLTGAGGAISQAIYPENVRPVGHGAAESKLSQVHE